MAVARQSCGGSLSCDAASDDADAQFSNPPSEPRIGYVRFRGALSKRTAE